MSLTYYKFQMKYSKSNFILHIQLPQVLLETSRIQEPRMIN